MQAFVLHQNARYGETIYRVEEPEPAPEMPPEPLPDPVIPPEGPDELPQCEVAPRATVASVSPSLTRIELELAHKALGLHEGNAVHCNHLMTADGPETALAEHLVSKGLMGRSKRGYHLTVAGLCAVEAKKPLFFGVIG